MALSSEAQQGLQAAGSGFWNAVNLGWNSIQNMKDKEWQAKFWKATYNQQLNDNLRYNSPSAQVARMKEAGLNTNLMYGSGVGSQPFSFGGEPGSISSHGANAVSSYDPLVESQVKVNEAQADNIEADTEKKKYEIEGLDTQNKMNKIYLSNLPEKERLTLATMDQNLVNLGKEGKLTDEKIVETSKNAKKLVEDAHLSKAQAEYAEAQTQYVGFYAKMKAAEVELESINTQLKGYGLILDAQGLKADLGIKELEAALKGAQALKEQYEADNYWKTTGIPKYIASVIALLASIIALKKVGKKPPSGVEVEKPVIIQPGSPHWNTTSTD